MTLDEAIRLLELESRCGEYTPDCDILKALKLGIEALKRIKNERVYHFSQGLIGINRLLPGETEK